MSRAMDDGLPDLPSVENRDLAEVRVSVSQTGATCLLLDRRWGWEDAERIKRALRHIGLEIVMEKPADPSFPY